MRTQKHRKGTFVLSVVTSAIVLLAVESGCRQKGPNAGSLTEAMGLVRQGDMPAALSMLEAIVQSNQDGRVGDEAALVLGNLLIDQNQHSKAVGFLARAEKGAEAQSYARLLLVRAIVDGGVADQYDLAGEKATALVNASSDDVSDLLREEATYSLGKLRVVQQVWPEASTVGQSFLAKWPSSKHAGEVRWLTANALTKQGRRPEAYALYAAIWYETPSSAWAKQSQSRLVELQTDPKIQPRRLNGEERYSFARALQRAGLHEDAVGQLQEYRANSGSNVDGSWLLTAASLQALRRPADVVHAAEQLRDQYPKSKWTPAAGIYAIRALRQSNNESAIRQWVRWLNTTHSGSREATEALYNLGTFLQNANKEDEGTAILEKLVEDAPRSGEAEDSLWKTAWAYRKKGQTDRTVAVLRRLFEQFPQSGYRKACLYWLARFTAENDAIGSRQLYELLLREFPNDYYGHEGGKNLIAMGGSIRQLGDDQAFPTIDRLERRDNRPDKSYGLAVNLKKVGLYEFAAEELQRVPGSDKDLQLQFALADLYSRSGKTWEAHDIVKKHFGKFLVSGSRNARLVPMDFWYIAYPYNYRATISKAIEEAGLNRALIEPPLVAALIRMESRFKSSAISSVGAIGLMQLMPQTAAEIASQRHLAPPSREDLFKPEVNIRYGTFFLAERVREFKGEWFPAICSYNAGVAPVRRWWANRPQNEPMDEFIETIPYLDTRLYIKQVLGDFRNYEWVYKQVQ